MGAPRAGCWVLRPPASEGRALLEGPGAEGGGQQLGALAAAGSGGRADAGAGEGGRHLHRCAAEREKKRKEREREGEKEGERWERKDRKLREAEKQKDGGGQGLKGEPKLRQAPELCSSAMPTPPNIYPSQTAGKGPGRPERRSGGVRQRGWGLPSPLQPSLWLPCALFPLHMGVLQSLRCSWETGDGLCRRGWVEVLSPAASTGMGAGETQVGPRPQGSAREPGIISARSLF